jgi:glycosyltransferase involved in cell wall biosynthesis
MTVDAGMSRSSVTPAISVGMPVYNGEPHLAAAIEAVLAQTDPDFELLISDNASTDGTADIARDYADRDARITYLRQPVNVGAAANYNLLFHAARAPLFRWFNADDLMEPTLHAHCRAALEAEPRAVLVSGQTRIIDAEGVVIEDYDDRLDLRQPRAVDRFARFFEVVGLTNVIYGLMRREALARTSLMGDGRLPAADTRMMAELVLQGWFVSLPEVLFYRRMHTGAISWQRNDAGAQAAFWRSGANPVRLSTWRSHTRWLRGLSSLDLPLRERLALLRYELRRMRWERRTLAHELLELAHRRPSSGGTGATAGPP